MKRTHLIFLIGGILIWGVALVLIFSRGPWSEVPADDLGSEPGTISGSGGVTGDGGGSGSGQSPDDTLRIRTKDGVVTVPDVRRGEGVQSLGSGNYVIGEQQGVVVPAYQLLFFERTNGFLISLGELPLAANRARAEEELRRLLGLSRSDFCSLASGDAIAVTTSLSVSDRYGGVTNLGISYCPGSVTLLE